MIEQTNDPEQWEDFWSAPYATDMPFLEAAHSHGCPFKTHGGTCTCSPVCTCNWPGSRCEYPHTAQDGAGAPSSPQPGTRGGSEVSQGLTGTLSIDSIAGLYADQVGIEGVDDAEVDHFLAAVGRKPFSRGIDYSALNDAVWGGADE